MTDKALLVCLCIAEHMGLPSTGPRSRLGTIFPVRNNAWLNAGPRALVAFSGSNGDIKFPHRLQILHESHETLLFDLHTTPSYSPGDLKLQARDLQCAMSVVAGYFGGYTSKLQDIGQKEVKRLSLTLDRQLPSVVASKSQAQAFQYYSRRLVRDLEAKLHWAVTRITPPGGASKETRAQWTAEGRDYLKECKLEGVRPECVPGVHYTALEDPQRILLPDLPGLRGLRHCWCWEKRKRLHLPTW